MKTSIHHHTIGAPTQPPAAGRRGRNPGRSLQSTSRRLATLASLAAALVLMSQATAEAGTYPMYQCGAGGTTAVAPGWSVYGAQTLASTQLTNDCSNGGALGDYVFTNGTPGAVTEDGDMGSQVGLALNVPASAPDVSISAITAQVIASPVSGDDAFLGFASDGQGLPGAAELPYGTSSQYSAYDSWTLPQGARDFEAYINCTTDKSSTTCMFPDATNVPALQNITLTLSDSVPPTIGSPSGTLATSAANSATVAGTQTLGFAAADSDSGVRSVTLTLTPQGGGTPYTQTIDYGAHCAYDSWAACPLQQDSSAFTLDTTGLRDDTYAVALSATDAAGNTATDELGSITTNNAPAIADAPTISGSPAVGQELTATPGATSSPSGAGTATSTGQWLRCDASGANCQAIPGATTTSYLLAPADAGSTIRYQQTAANTDGSSSAMSAPLGPVPSSGGQGSGSGGGSGGTGGSGSGGSGGSGSGGSGGVGSGGTGSGGSSGSGSGGSGGGGGPGGSGSGGGVTITILPDGAVAGVELGSTAKWRVGLTVSPRQVHKHTVIKLTGTVSTAPRPPAGKLIYLQARTVAPVWRGSGRHRHRVTVYGSWISFATLRASANGSFRTTYRFRVGGMHRYQFHAVAPQEGGYRNRTGTSTAVTVTEN